MTPHLDPERQARDYSDRVAPVWDEPLGDAVLPHIAYPDGATVLVADCRAGHVCEAVLNAASGSVRLMAVDSSREMLDIARQRVYDPAFATVFFSCEQADRLSYATGVFSHATCLAAPHTFDALDPIVGELNRVLRPGGQLIVAAPTPESVALFTDLLRESIWSMEMVDVGTALDIYLASLVAPERLHDSIRRRGGRLVASGEVDVELNLSAAKELLSDPLIRAFFLPRWFELLPANAWREIVLQDVLNRAETYFSGLRLCLPVVAHWVVATTGSDREEHILEPTEDEIEEIDEFVNEERTAPDFYDPAED